MSDIKLFRIVGNKATEVPASASTLEKPLQNLIEQNLEVLLGIRFLATEYSTGKTHAGRIDTLGLDEDNCPVIIEYKRSASENVINQGLFYLDWLLDHRGEFKLLAMERCGKAVANEIDWESPRLLCIASDFTKYDSHAVQQMNHNIELIRYRWFGQDQLLLELVNAVATETPAETRGRGRPPLPPLERARPVDKTVGEWFSTMSPELRGVFESLERYVLSLGDDVLRKDLKLYVAFKRLRNFATVCFQKHRLQLYLRLDPDTVDLEEGFTKDVRDVGHWGTGDVEVSLSTPADLTKAKPLIARAYAGNSHAG